MLDFSTYKQTTHKYSAPEGRDEGMLAQEDIFSSEGWSGVAGIPGTDSNDDLDSYVMEDDGRSSSNQSEQSRSFLPDEDITVRDTPAGLIDYSQSSLMAYMYKYNIVREEDVRLQ